MTMTRNALSIEGQFIKVYYHVKIRPPEGCWSNEIIEEQSQPGLIKDGYGAEP